MAGSGRRARREVEHVESDEPVASSSRGPSSQSSSSRRAHKEERKASATAVAAPMAAADGREPSSSSPPPVYSNSNPQLFCYIVAIDRELTSEEYFICMRTLDGHSRKRVEAVLNTQGQRPEENKMDAYSCLCGRMLPHIVMAQRRTQNPWHLRDTEVGKRPYIEEPDNPKKIGYNIAREPGVVSMAFAMGDEDRVQRIGTGIHPAKVLSTVSIEIFLASELHWLHPKELEALLEEEREVITRRVAILHALKMAVMKALNHPLKLGFDWRRLCFDVKTLTFRLDETDMYGWEFRLFIAHQTRPDAQNKSAEFQVCCAIHRGSYEYAPDGSGKVSPRPNVFHFQKAGEEANTGGEWIRFLTVDAIISGMMTLPYRHIIEHNERMAQLRENAAMKKRQAQAAQAQAVQAQAPAYSQYVVTPQRQMTMPVQSRKGSMPFDSGAGPASGSVSPMPMPMMGNGMGSAMPMPPGMMQSMQSPPLAQAVPGPAPGGPYRRGTR